MSINSINSYGRTAYPNPYSAKNAAKKAEKEATVPSECADESASGKIGRNGFEYATVAEYKAALRISAKPTEEDLARRVAYRDSLRGAEIGASGAINPERLAQEKEKAAKYAPIQAKLNSGQKLTPEEKSFLRENYPEVYGEAIRIESETANLRNQLKSAKSKEDAQRIYMNAVMRSMSVDMKSFNPWLTAALENEYGGF